MPTIGKSAWTAIGIAVELGVAASIAVVWLGTRPESVKYTDLSPLYLIALIPPIGWLWRGEIGWLWGSLTWSGRLLCIASAMFMWARANDHQIFRLQNNPSTLFTGDYCCRTEWLAGMHISMAVAVAIPLLSAFALWFLGVCRAKEMPGVSQ